MDENEKRIAEAFKIGITNGIREALNKELPMTVTLLDGILLVEIPLAGLTGGVDLASMRPASGSFH